MTARVHLSWLGVAILAGASYGFIGIVFGLPSSHVRIWRLAAWAVSGVVYMCHLAYERYWLGALPLTTAPHVAVAVAIGVFRSLSAQRSMLLRFRHTHRIGGLSWH